MKKETEMKTKGIHEAYAGDPEKADLEIFGRKVDPITRRGFIKKASLLSMASAVGSQIPFAHNMPGGLIPALLANSEKPFSIEGKDGLIYLNDRPINAETPPQFLDSRFTEPKYFYIRNNGTPPELKSIDPAKWILEIAGESCLKPMRFSIQHLKDKFKAYTYALTIEC